MVYVTSDLHGCSVDTFQQLLGRSGFTDDDFLFVLGDVIDRGEHGVELLCWITQQPNIQLILGNHEGMLLSCGFLFDEVTDENLDRMTEEELHLLTRWIRNGAAPTIQGFQRLMQRDPELVYGILDYLRDAPLYETLKVNGQRFVLVHAGLDNFHPDKKMEDYDPHDLIWARPELHTRYDGDAMVIFGHTPTSCFGDAYEGRAVRTDTWICVDVGAAYGNTPMLLRLDDLKEFY